MLSPQACPDFVGTLELVRAPRAGTRRVRQSRDAADDRRRQWLRARRRPSVVDDVDLPMAAFSAGAARTVGNVGAGGFAPNRPRSMRQRRVLRGVRSCGSAPAASGVLSRRPRVAALSALSSRRGRLRREIARALHALSRHRCPR